LKRVGEIYITIWQALGEGTCELWLLSSFCLLQPWQTATDAEVVFDIKGCL